jgi:hypothetical protein
MSLVPTFSALPSIPLPRRRAKLSGKTSIECAAYYMLQLYRANLDVRLRGIDESSLQTETQKQIYAAATALLRDSADDNATEWDDVYKAERLIVLLLSGQELRYEIGARLQDVAAEKISQAERLRREYETLVPPPADSGASPADDGVLRLFLMRIMELLHSIAKKKLLIRPIRKQATRNILILVMIAFVLVIFPYLYLVVDYDTTKVGVDRIRTVWSLFALYTALMSGLLGAFFSRLISLNSQWSTTDLDEVFLHREFAYTLLRAGVGMCGALIVYFFLQSGIIEGKLFPEFDKLAIRFVEIPGPAAQSSGEMPAVQMALTVPSMDLALLIIWCFLAGFSERLVPSILLNTERQFTTAAASPKT